MTTRETLEHMVVHHGMELGVAAVIPTEVVEQVHVGDHLLADCDHNHEEVSQ